MTRNPSHREDKDRDPVDKTTTETGEFVINGTKVIFEIKKAKPGTAMDERLRVAQTRALFALLQDVIARRSQADEGP
jgi:hypothetical protein